MDKKQVKQIQITEVKVNRLNQSSDPSGEYTTHCDVDFYLSETFTFNVFDKTHTIDRIKMDSSWGVVGLYYANADTCFICLPVSKSLVHKVYDRSKQEEKDGCLKGWIFHDDIFEMLTRAQPTSTLC